MATTTSTASVIRAFQTARLGRLTGVTSVCGATVSFDGTDLFVRLTADEEDKIRVSVRCNSEDGYYLSSRPSNGIHEIPLEVLASFFEWLFVHGTESQPEIEAITGCPCCGNPDWYGWCVSGHCPCCGYA